MTHCYSSTLVNYCSTEHEISVGVSKNLGTRSKAHDALTFDRLFNVILKRGFALPFFHFFLNQWFVIFMNCDVDFFVFRVVVKLPFDLSADNVKISISIGTIL